MKNFFTIMLFCATIFLISCQKDKSVIPILGVTINLTDLTLDIGAKKTLIATIAPENITNKSVSWSSSNELVATISKSGEIVAISVGKTTITVVSDVDKSKRATCLVTVTNSIVKVTELTLNKQTLSLVHGSVDTLFAALLPLEATDKRVTWLSSNTKVATVSENGEVSAKEAGTTTITATSVDDKSKMATCLVTVTNSIVKVTELTLNKQTLSLVPGGAETLLAALLPLEATDKRVTWSSSNTKVATVSENGEVSAKEAGTTTITATSVDDQSKMATCLVTVTNPIIKVTELTLNKQTLSLVPGGAETLLAALLPLEATDKRVTWSSSNTKVATVSENGEVSAKEAGTATITATSVDDQSKMATCLVTVTNSIIKVTELTLNKQTLSLVPGGAETLLAALLPLAATDKRVTWSSSNTKVATISENGEVSAKEAGTATITATSVDDQSKMATCLVTVPQNDIAVTLVGINNKPLSMLIGGTGSLLVTVLPNNATNPNLTWSSNNESVATVSSTGAVVASGTGVAIITVASVSDNTKTDQCVVTVTAPVVTTAAIGNYYYSDETQTRIYDKTKTCLGVVFWVDPTNAQKGKIVSLDEAEFEWSPKIETTRAANNTNGRPNMYLINQFIRANDDSEWVDYPAFDWVATKKNARHVGGWDDTDRWCLPSQGELVSLFATIETVNVSLNAISNTVVLKSDFYCSSTEKDDESAVFVSLSTGLSQNLRKFSANKIRAVAGF